MDGDRSAWGATDAERIRTLTDHWMALQGVLGSVRKADRQDWAWCLRAGEQVGPHQVPPPALAAFRRVARALVEHFGA
jgi:hypothetical protein